MKLAEIYKHTFVRASAIVVFIGTIVTGMIMIDDRYAKAGDTKQTMQMMQQQNVKTMQAMQTNLAIIGLKSTRSDLRAERRTLIGNTSKTAQCKLKEIDEELSAIQQSITNLEMF